MEARRKERNTKLRIYRKDVNPKQRPVTVSDSELEEALMHSKGKYAEAERWLRKNCDTVIEAHGIRARALQNRHLEDVRLEAKKANNRHYLEKALTIVEEKLDEGDISTAKWYIVNGPDGKDEGFGAKVSAEISNAENDVFRIAPFDVQGKSREEIMQMVKEAWGK